MFKTLTMAVAMLVSSTQAVDTRTFEPVAEITKKVYFDVAVDGGKLGRVVFGLYGKEEPKTVANFMALSVGDLKSKLNGEQMAYKNTVFHRIIPGFMAQGGDFEFGNGRGGESIYGKKFDDENFDVGFERPYQLAMANAGPNTNGSQFFVTFKKTDWLDGKHVVFGEVLGGKDVIDAMEKFGTGNGNPTAKVTVIDAGLYTEEEKKTFEPAVQAEIKGEE